MADTGRYHWVYKTPYTIAWQGIVHRAVYATTKQLNNCLVDDMQFIWLASIVILAEVVVLVASIAEYIAKTRYFKHRSSLKQSEDVADHHRVMIVVSY
jgi:hypothetical protein